VGTLVTTVETGAIGRDDLLATYGTISPGARTGASRPGRTLRLRSGQAASVPTQSTTGLGLLFPSGLLPALRPPVAERLH
jgi:hypothetical protein